MFVDPVPVRYQRLEAVEPGARDADRGGRGSGSVLVCHEEPNYRGMFGCPRTVSKKIESTVNVRSAGCTVLPQYKLEDLLLGDPVPFRIPDPAVYVQTRTTVETNRTGTG